MKLNLIFTFFIITLFAGCRNNTDFTQPNILLILADDLGYGDLGCYGCRDIKTPVVDRLAEQGVRFTQFYANGPECTPTRAALLSGLYQQRIGGLECAIGAGNVGRYDEAQWLSGQKKLGLPPDFAILPNRLKEQGYNTAVIGKWHLGYEEKFRPDRQGFDYSIGPVGYGGDYFYHVEQAPVKQPDLKEAHTLVENGKEVFRDGEYMTKLITEEAVNWLNKNGKGEPFFLYLPFTAPHSPYQGPKDDLGRPIQGEEWNFKSRDKYIEMVEAMDKGIGKILQSLANLKLEKETIVIFFSDNGGTRIANNGILSGFKGHVYEGGIRVPCIIRWPGLIQVNTVSDQVSISFDLSRSILNLAEINTEKLKTDGYDIVNHVIQDLPDFDRTLFWRVKRGNSIKKAVRDGNYKYLTEIKNDTTLYVKLFNLENDPSEKNDLFMSQSDKVKIMEQKLIDWENEVKAARLQTFPGSVE